MQSLLARIGALALATVLGGCAVAPAEPALRRVKVNCDGQAGSTAIVTIDQTERGNYSVSPKVCRVKGARPMLFTTTTSPNEGFTVTFTGPSPHPNGQRVFEGRKPNNAAPEDPYEVAINLVPYNGAGNNTYVYEVTVGTQTIDPSIIIEPH
jgi:hypothetical protein